MAVAGITLAGSLLTKTGQMKIAGCLLRRRAQKPEVRARTMWRFKHGITSIDRLRTDCGNNHHHVVTRLLHLEAPV